MVKKVIPILCAAVLVGGMTFAAEFLNNREIIFPEIAAIAVGALVSPKFLWNSSKPRIFAYISVCACLGVAIVKWLPLPVWAQMITAFVLAQILLVNSKTSFAPMISAAVLPVMLQTETPIYIAAAVILTALIMLCRTALEKAKILEKNEFTPLPKTNSAVYKNVLFRTLFAAAMIVSALLLDFKFAVAPPLLVAFTEFSNPKSKARNTPVKAVVLISVCGFLGAALRYVFCVNGDILPLYAIAVITILCVIALMKVFKLFIPPAGAISILAMLIPEGAVMMFPMQILAGTTLIMFIAKLVFNYK